MSSRKLEDTIPEMGEFANRLIERMKIDLDVKVIVTSVSRDYEEQVALYAQGRQPLDEINQLRKFAGMSPIELAESKRKVTWTLSSKHIVKLRNEDISDDLSRAIDFGILDSNGKYRGDDKADVNSDNKSDYLQLGEIGRQVAEELGYSDNIRWGGDFSKNKDYPHFEWRS